jgi:TonB-dependent receptor
MLERYYGRSIFSAGLFYKGIEDFIFSYKRFGREGEPGSGNYPIFELTKPVNGRNAQVFGAEVQAQFKFELLPGFWRRFGLFSNYTFTEANAFIPKRVPANYSEAIIINPVEDDLTAFFEDESSEQISLPGQAAHSANVGLFYDYKKLFIRLSSNYQSDFLIQIGPDPDFDVYYDAALRLDLTANYQVKKGISVFIDAINITDTPLRYYMGKQDNIQKLEYYSWWTRFGLRLTY